MWNAIFSVDKTNFQIKSIIIDTEIGGHDHSTWLICWTLLVSISIEMDWTIPDISNNRDSKFLECCIQYSIFLRFTVYLHKEDRWECWRNSYMNTMLVADNISSMNWTVLMRSDDIKPSELGNNKLVKKDTTVWKLTHNYMAISGSLDMRKTEEICTKPQKVSEKLKFFKQTSNIPKQPRSCLRRITEWSIT